MKFDSMIRLPLALAAVVGLSLAGAASAHDAPGEHEHDLKVGDPAPELYVSQWFNAEPIEDFEEGKVYVIENWATWCGPCIQAIPHLNELYQEHKNEGLVVIGLNVWDDDAKAVKFVEQQGEKMSYPIAIDDRSEGPQSGKSAKAWLEAAGRNGIPAAFVVDQEGTIVWIGHPMAGMDQVVKQVLAGEYDAEAEAAAQAKLMPLQQKLQEALQAQQWDPALEAIDELAAVLGDDDPRAEQLHGMRVLVLLGGKQDYEAGYAAMTKAVEGPLKNNPDALNGMARFVVAEQSLEQRDLTIAAKAAERAVELSDGENGLFLDTLARVRFDQGDAAAAATLQQDAIDHAEGLPPQALEQMKATLQEYREASEDEVAADASE